MTTIILIIFYSHLVIMPGTVRLLGDDIGDDACLETAADDGGISQE